MKKHILLLIFQTTAMMAWSQAAFQESFQQELFTVSFILQNGSAINLSQQQEARIIRINNEIFQQFDSKRNELQIELGEMAGLVSSASVNETQAMTQMDKVLQLENELKKIRLNELISMKNELTIAQQTKLKELKKGSDSYDLLTLGKLGEVRISNSPNGRPLYILRDGRSERKMREGEIELLHPDRISSMQVLRGESATSRYGEEGKNGVIIVELK